MSIRFNEASIPGRHTLSYRVRDHAQGFPTREVEVLATPEEIETLTRDGYLVRERLLPMDEIERLRAALDETVARDDRLETMGGRAFGGIFIRHLMDKHPAFWNSSSFRRRCRWGGRFSARTCKCAALRRACATPTHPTRRRNGTSTSG